MGETQTIIATTHSAFQATACTLQDAPKTWLVTDVAGFIGTNLLEQLLKLDQTVVNLDSFSTGKRRNLDEVSPSSAQTAGPGSAAMPGGCWGTSRRTR